MQLWELATLYGTLSTPAQRLVVLYTQALLLKQESHQHSARKRLALVEDTFRMDSPALIQQARQITKEGARFIDQKLGVSAAWLLGGSTDALAARILEFCRESRLH